MSVIQASSAGVKDMADGSLRITFEFDPRFAKDAYSLFGARGTACAIAALTLEASTKAAQQEAQEQAEKPKGGALAKLAGMWCGDPEFWEFCTKHFNGAYSCLNADEAAALIRTLCVIESRAELDSNAEAAQWFHEHIRLPYMAWKEGRNT